MTFECDATLFYIPFLFFFLNIFRLFSQPNQTADHSFWFLFFEIPEARVGGICLFVAICLTYIRKTIARKLSVDFLGGSKTLYALSFPVVATMLSPFATWEYFNVSNVSVSPRVSLLISSHLSFFLFF
jgi:hypothetical protein